MAQSENLKTLIKTRGSLKSNVTRLITYLNAHPDAEIDDIQNRKIKLEEGYEAFSKTQLQIEILAEKEKHTDMDHEAHRSQFDDQYFACAKIISKRLREINSVISPIASTSPSTSATPSMPITIKQANNLLPKIEIRPYDGNPINWYSFHDTFKNLVHDNDELLPVHKFYLLQNALQGPLTSITENLNASEENYLVAWNTLKQRCNKPRQIIHTHLQLLLELPEIHRETPTNLRSLVEKTQVHINALRALKQPVDKWDALLIYIVVKKLDKGTRRAWERTLEDEEMPAFQKLLDFLSKQARGDDFDTISFDSNKSNSHFNNHTSKMPNKKRPNQIQSHVGTQAHFQCPACSQNHAIYTCNKFLQLNPKERFELARRAKLCLNCLRGNHQTNKCYLSGCKTCNHKHNTLLHFTDTNNPRNHPTNNSIESNDQNIKEQPTVNLVVSSDSEVLLGTASIKILDKDKNEIPCRVLLDGGSQTHFITERLADRLKLNKTMINLPFSGLGQNLTKSQYTVKTTIKSRTSPFSCDLTLVALPTITGLLPSRKIDKDNLSIPKNISLADPNFHKSAEIDALLGNTLFYQLLSVGQIKLCNDSIILQKTRLGWIVTGEVNLLNNHLNKARSCFVTTALENQLNKFWEVEEIPNKKYFSSEESACETHFSQNIKRNLDGRYVVRLPFNEKRDSIGESHRMALKRFYSLEKRLELSSELKNQYSVFLREYVELKHMTDITNTDDKQVGYYLPHHAVIKESSATTKVRVVFDGSAKTSTSISLNDALMQGPTIQDDLISIIIRFRTHQFVLTADIEKMFRQIQVHPDDAKFQKILWRENKTEPIKTYMLNTVTYGTTSAPFLAVRCLKQIIKDDGHKYPLAATVLDRDFYVDDLLTGTNDLNQACLLIDQLTKLLNLGGFNLRQWLSNEPKLLNKLKNSSASQLVCLDVTETKKVLGIQWDPHADTINYKVNPFSSHKVVSKRTILSEIAQLFDPLGLLGPVIIQAKLVMQKLWMANLNWDESVPQSIHTEWFNYKNQLPLLNNFTVHRKVVLNNAVEIQLHGFCDASEKGYGACFYIRSTNKVNNHLVGLVCAKSRVAPIKTISLPRLELCAAKLLANLYKSVVEALNLRFNKINFYSDSTIALNWIKTSPHILKTFEANRVSEIQTLTDRDNWYHVSTNDNPADFISRGQNPSDFIKNTLWVNGPTWLSMEEHCWKITKLSTSDSANHQANVTFVTLDQNCNRNKVANDTFERFSSINALNRFVALCHRAIVNRSSSNKITGEITTKELHDAHLQIIRVVQESEFSQELQCLRKGEELNNKSRLLRLDPFIDELGILRVGGRLGNADINYSHKHPILLPRNNHITDIIIRHVHIKYWHTGVQNTLAIVRQNYWPIDGKNRTRYVLHKCISCCKLNHKPPNYPMGILPKNRLKQSRPFENAGLDYCGPFLIKEKKFRNKVKIKSYVVVFVCFSTKAVHLELVTDLTTETCLAAIKRFFGRRGKSKNLYSDNGTNFVGAKNEILKIKALLLSSNHNDRITHDLSNEGVNWHFSPPQSPHFGGLWEAGVKQFKYHLYRTVGDSLFTYEQFNTFIIEIESILNSRPLTPLSSDPNDFSALTPAHFLIGDSLMSIPEHDFQDVPTNRLSLWQHIVKVKQHFWKRWHREYFNELLLRSKWHKGDPEQIKIDTLVTIKEDNIPPMHWSMGRIIAVHPGEDKIIRVATVKTNRGIYKRCIKKLCPLPIEIPERD
ncbi:uncharacterized protein LOC117603975 [Osmia lignaria lignaria]|uniref:uncharacterized protein LOC117603975 n=1 Tax=Osmia lignaria lignaria TaxID=1437193 RepID=UPI00402BDD46